MKSVKQTDILTGSIPKQLLLFFLPIWFGTLFQQLYNTVDTIVVGQYVGFAAARASSLPRAGAHMTPRLWTGRYTRRLCSVWGWAHC